MTERTFVSQSSGPVILGLSLPVGSIRVQVVDGLPTARVVLSTGDTTGPAADAVNRASSRQDGQALGIEVPEMPGNVTMQGRRSNMVFGSVTGVTMINGRVVSGGGTVPTVSMITATVHLPAGSSLGVVSTSADARTFGYLDRVEFRSVSGDLDADGVRHLTASTTSGDISAGCVTQEVTARTVSGDISIDLYNGRTAELNTTSGDVVMQATNHASGPVRAHSVSGDVRVSGSRHLNVSAHSVSGRVRTR
ncbi:DUF4097 family beta strand repeat-containing protein [Streptomyces sp. NPDC051569]|uniref:DUF4097 family beta strand repeat-containing protein n=1 Tax=Streptomyces sp. NPDC051569 TaxID=3365661 RepID=UPI003791718B